MPAPKLNKHGLKDQEQAFLDLVLSGWSQNKAFQIVYPNRALSAESISTSSSRLKASPQAKNYLEHKKAIGTGLGRVYDVHGDDVPLTKEELIQELTAAFRTTADAKLKSEIGMKLADIQQYKKDTIEAEQLIHYYLPLSEKDFVKYIDQKMTHDIDFKKDIKKMIAKNSSIQA